MPLVADDVRQILEEAVVQAKFATRDVAASFGKATAASVTDGLNAILGPDQQIDPEPAMTIPQALQLRDEVSTVISEAGPVPTAVANSIAEHLIVAGLIDVGGVWHSLSQVVKTGLIATVQTGQHAAQPVLSAPVPVQAARISTGSVPAVDPGY